MEEGMRSRRKLDDIPDLIHCIQSLLPVKEAARTCVLSKSWLHAWSTIPTLRFRQALWSATKQQQRNLLNLFDRTLKRYLDEKLPINSINHKIYIKDEGSSSSRAQNLIQLLAMQSCLEQLSLKILVESESLMLPDEILSGKNLTKLRLSTWNDGGTHSVSMSNRPVNNCVSLRELHFDKLHISEEVLDHIFSTCKLLVKIKLIFCKGELKTIKINNLDHLNELTISTVSCTVLEINHVPNLSLFVCGIHLQGLNPLHFNEHSLSLGANVTQLSLRGVIIDDACMDMIQSKLPFLKILSLNLRFWGLGKFEITCASIESLSLMWCPRRLPTVIVNTPRLTFFALEGMNIPSLMFPHPLQQIKIVVFLYNPVEASFFVKMYNALRCSSKCYIEITTMNNTVIQPPFDEDILDLIRERIPFPTKNVRQLSFKTVGDEGKWEHSLFFDALFSICHPRRVIAKPDARSINKIRTNHLLKVMVSEVMEKNTRMVSEYLRWPYYLKSFEIIPENQYPDITVFKLDWR